MKKKELRKKILFSYTEKLDDELKHQEELKNSDDKEIREGAYHAIGYITATKYYEKIFLELIDADKKELKRIIKYNKKVSEENKKTLKNIFKKIKKKNGET